MSHCTERFDIPFQERGQLHSSVFCYIQLLSHQNHNLTYLYQTLSSMHTTHLMGLAGEMSQFCSLTLCTAKLTGVKSTENHGTSTHEQLKPCKSYMKMKKILQLFSSASLSLSLPQHFTELQPECLCSRVKLAQPGATAGCPNQQLCNKYLLFNP